MTPSEGSPCQQAWPSSASRPVRAASAASMWPRLAVYSGCEHAGAYDEYPVRYVEELVSYFDERLGE